MTNNQYPIFNIDQEIRNKEMGQTDGMDINRHVTQNPKHK